MFTTDQIADIERRAERGETDPEIATAYDISVNQLRYGLMRSGKRFETRRFLVDTAPMDAPEVEQQQGVEA